VKKNNTLKIDIALQNEIGSTTVPSIESIQKWVETAYQGNSNTSLCIRIVDVTEGEQLNAAYRGKAYATNVLSFPFEAPPIPVEVSFLSSYLGDLALCEPVIQHEAIEQQKVLMQHWAHLIIHGILHLQGYDHITESEAHQMESLEIRLLEHLGFANPYTIQ
jgi:probable rRNA maturation factor